MIGALCQIYCSGKDFHAIAASCAFHIAQCTRHKRHPLCLSRYVYSATLLEPASHRTIYVLLMQLSTVSHRTDNAREVNQDKPDFKRLNSDSQQHDES